MMSAMDPEDALDQLLNSTWSNMAQQLSMLHRSLSADIQQQHRERKAEQAQQVTGCKNFERLPATPQMHRWMAEEYAKARNFDVEKCFELMRAYRSVQPGKIDNLY